MAKYELVELNQKHIPEHIQDFLEAVIELDLYFHSRTLENIYPSEAERRLAIARAMRICGNIGIPLDRHFRKRYIADNTSHSLREVWQMSKTAYCLTLINGDVNNPMVGRFQWELIEKIV